jgi:FAD/FMN-containing dehydrogenase
VTRADWTAREHNIRLIVKSSGHDFIGRSSGGNSLSIWVHRMKGTTLHEESFSPKGCNVTVAGAAMTVLGGSQMTEMYSSADSINHVPLGANGRSVAIGGFITGGGHSIIGPQYGMAGDHVLEVEVVTPMGEILTLNECQNTDLFWAIRGVSVLFRRRRHSGTNVFRAARRRSGS